MKRLPTRIYEIGKNYLNCMFDQLCLVDLIKLISFYQFTLPDYVSSVDSKIMEKWPAKIMVKSKQRD